MHDLSRFEFVNRKSNVKVIRNDKIISWTGSSISNESRILLKKYFYFNVTSQIFKCPGKGNCWAKASICPFKAETSPTIVKLVIYYFNLAHSWLGLAVFSPAKFSFCNWDCFIVWDFLIFEAVKLCRMKR